MIKKFEDFLGKGHKPLNENRYSSDEDTYLEIIVQIKIDCMRETIHFVNEQGGRIETKNKFSFYTPKNGKYGDMNDETLKYKQVLSFEIDDDVEFVEDLFDGEEMMYEYNGEFLVAITDDGERIPVDFWTCPTDTIVSIYTKLVERHH